MNALEHIQNTLIEYGFSPDTKYSWIKDNTIVSIQFNQYNNTESDEQYMITTNEGSIYGPNNDLCIYWVIGYLYHNKLI